QRISPNEINDTRGKLRVSFSKNHRKVRWKMSIKYFLASLYTEGLKIIKSKVIWIIAAAFSIAPLMAGFFMFVLKDPELAKSSGLVGAQAQIAGEANWQSYMELHAQMIAV